MFEFLSRAISRRKESVTESRGLKLSNPINWPIFGLSSYKKGDRIINEDSSLSVSAWAACVNKIARGISSSPWKVYISDGEKRMADKENNLYGLLKTRPHKDYTSAAFRKSLIHNAINYGVGLAKINRDSNAIENFDLWHSGQSYRVELENHQIYWVNLDKNEVVHQDDMIVILDFATDARNPKSRLKIYAEALGLSLESKEMAINLYKSGLYPPGFLMTDGKLDPSAKPGLISSIVKGIRDVENTGGIGLLEHGLKFEGSSIPPQNAQFIETRNMSTDEICQILGVHPRHITNSGSGTKSNSEQHDMEFVRDVLMPWAVQIEQEFDYKCFGLVSDRYNKIDLKGLLRGDFKAQTERMKFYIQNGWSIDEVRAFDDQNPLPDGLGKIRPIQLNTLDLKEYKNYSKKIAETDGKNA